MKLDKVVEGKHNRESFRYENGFLQMFGRHWDKADIQTLIEVANLLSVEGYTIKVPTCIGKRRVENPLWGGTYEVDAKTYDDETEEK